MLESMVAAKTMGDEPRRVRYLVEKRASGYGCLGFSDIQVSGGISIDEQRERIEGVDSPFQDLNQLDVPLNFYEGVNKNSGNRCCGGCICSIQVALGTAEKRPPGTLKKANYVAILMGHWEGDVIHPDGMVFLVGSGAGVGGTLKTPKVVRLRGCPVKVKDLMRFLLVRLNINSPVFDLRSLILPAYHAIVSGWIKLTLPFREKARMTR